MWYVYILECGDGSLYTGVTNDLRRRHAEHREGKGGSYTRSKKGVRRIAFTEQLLTRSAALRREAEIKSWRRKKKITLIESDRRTPGI